jgi:hypothetical protein
MCELMHIFRKDTVTKNNLNYETDLDYKHFKYQNIIQGPENHSLDLKLKLTLFPIATQ